MRLYVCLCDSGNRNNTETNVGPHIKTHNTATTTNVGFEVFTAVTMKNATSQMTAFFNYYQCSGVEEWQNILHIAYNKSIQQEGINKEYISNKCSWWVNDKMNCISIFNLRNTVWQFWESMFAWWLPSGPKHVTRLLKQSVHKVAFNMVISEGVNNPMQQDGKI
jgi:hypothetical protein